MSEAMLNRNGAEPVTILVVDDDAGHCELIRRSLRRAAVRNPVIVVPTARRRWRRCAPRRWGTGAAT